MYVIPCFISGCFPITLQRLYTVKAKDLQEAHFKQVVKRVFGYNLDTKEETIFYTGVFDKFMRYLNHDTKQNVEVRQIFGKNILDESDNQGCFESDFNYWFSDSEQVFIKWLDECDTIDPILGNTKDFPDFTYGDTDLTELNNESRIIKVDINLLSYLDMCPACRGTFSLLMQKEDAQLSWIEQRVRKLIGAWIYKRKNDQNDYCNIWNESVAMNIFCTSLAKCDKGEKK